MKKYDNIAVDVAGTAQRDKMLSQYSDYGYKLIQVVSHGIAMSTLYFVRELQGD